MYVYIYIYMYMQGGSLVAQHFTKLDNQKGAWQACHELRGLSELRGGTYILAGLVFVAGVKD